MSIQRIFKFFTTILFWLYPIFLTIVVLSLTSRYQEYHDLGVNMGANNAFLMFFVGPILLISLYFIAWLSFVCLEKVLPQRKNLYKLLTLSVVTICAGMVFLYKTYPFNPHSERPPGLSLFFKYYIEQNF